MDTRVSGVKVYTENSPFDCCAELGLQSTFVRMLSGAWVWMYSSGCSHVMKNFDRFREKWFNLCVCVCV